MAAKMPEDQHELRAHFWDMNVPSADDENCRVGFLELDRLLAQLEPVGAQLLGRFLAMVGAEGTTLVCKLLVALSIQVLGRDQS